MPRAGETRKAGGVPSSHAAIDHDDRAEMTGVSRGVLVHLASKWGALVLRQLSRGERRYSEIRWAVAGISEKMLAQTLRDLEGDGLVSRTSYPVVPPHVVYRLTPLGEECATHVATLISWIELHVGDLMNARAQRARQPNGIPAQL
jgi:DNA-binding HxlR family transcriptional regulator